MFLTRTFNVDIARKPFCTSKLFISVDLVHGCMGQCCSSSPFTMFLQGDSNEKDLDLLWWGLREATRTSLWIW